MTLSVVSVAVEVSEIVPAVLTVLVPVPETVLAVRLIVLSVSVRLITLWSLWNGAGRGVPRGAAAWW